MLEEGPVDLIKIDPEPSTAIYALSVAEEFLREAQEHIRKRNYEEACESAKNAARMASSAVLYNDGYVAKTLGTTCYYLEQHYPKKFPVEEWRVLEVGTTEKIKIVERILYFLRLKKKKKEDTEKNARKALTIAEIFVASVRTIVTGERGYACDTTKKEE